MAEVVTGLLLSPSDCRLLAGVLSEGVRVVGAEVFSEGDLALLRQIVDTARSSVQDAEDPDGDTSWDNESRELTTADAADLLGVTARQVSRLIKAGRLPASKVRGHYRLARADVEALRSA